MNVSDWPLYHYRSVVSQIIDGDTVELKISLGCRIYWVRRVRLLGFDAPELFSGTNRDAGAASRDALAALLPIGTTVYLRTELDRTSFDRLLGHLFVAGDGDELLDVAESMIAATSRP